MIFLALPNYHSLTQGTLVSVLRADLNHTLDIKVTPNKWSLLTLNFNKLWCDMLNLRKRGTKVEYFCMLHSDIEVLEDNWLPRLISIMEDNQPCDVLSIVSPIKDEKRLTSTGIFNLKEKCVSRRFTIKETNKFPETFGIDDVRLKNDSDWCLIVNTAVMLVKVGDWCKEVCFGQNDFIYLDSNGDFQAGVISEDWLFSIDCHIHGRVCKATRAIKIKHLGEKEYDNWTDGGLEHDDLS